jgi:hypothetical protein
MIWEIFASLLIVVPWVVGVRHDERARHRRRSQSGAL